MPFVGAALIVDTVSTRLWLVFCIYVEESDIDPNPNRVHAGGLVLEMLRFCLLHFLHLSRGILSFHRYPHSTHLQEFNRAYNAYSAALKLSPVGPSSHVFLSNRAAALLSLRQY